jgi:L-ascorbate metabolism protein UlaG (beta-lactamase superfamily)
MRWSPAVSLTSRGFSPPDVIVPLQAGEALLADVAAADRSAALLHVWWLGQAGFLIAHAGRHLVVDPYLSDTLTEKYAGSATPHVRMTERVLAPEQLAFADAVLASHHHGDHLDGGTLAPLLRAAPGAMLVAPAAHRALALERAQVEAGRVLDIDVGRAVSVRGIRIAGVPAAHEELARDAAGRWLHLGFVISAGPFRIHHAGDTVPFPGQAAGVGPVDVALLPINGRGAGVPGNLDGAEAAALAAALPARMTVPCHFGMFTFNTASPAAFLARCGQLGVAARVLRAGERLTLAASDEFPAPTRS